MLRYLDVAQYLKCMSLLYIDLELQLLKMLNVNKKKGLTQAFRC